MVTWFFSKKKTVHHRAKKGGDDFTSISSHELRSPLSVIKWYTEILLDEDAGKLTDDQRKYLKLIESSNQRAIDLVRALLNVSRLDLDTFCISPEETSINCLLNEAVTSLKALADKKNVALHFDPAGIRKVISVDKSVTLLILKSLLSNAITYSNDKAEVRITFSEIKSGGTYLGVNILDDSLIISVSDDGIGIPDVDKAKIATKMYRAENVGDTQGSGLSLYIAKTVMQKVHGRFGFVSELGKGSTFFIALPLRGMIKKEGRTTLE
jgi:two-component system phosphate regulon sensor histidine kinase PhoR